MVRIYAITPKTTRSGEIVTATLYFLNDETSKASIQLNVSRDVLKFLDRESKSEFLNVNYQEIKCDDPDAILRILKFEGYEFEQ